MNTTNPQGHWDGLYYNQHSDPQYTTGMEMLKEYTFRGDERVLDIGCGAGRTTLEIATRVPQGEVLGVDSSASMIAVAEQRHSSHNLKYQQLDAQDLNFNQEFDLITSNFCLHWIPNKLQVFKGIYQALKPNGVVLLVMSMRNTIIKELRYQLTQKSAWQPYFNHYIDPTVHWVDTSYDEYAKAVGLSVFRYMLDSQPLLFNDLQSFTEFLSAITMHLSQLPTQAHKDLFMQELMQDYIRIVPQDSEGYFRMNSTRIKLQKRKLA